jgi:phosphoglycolate phosphatase-like HAD superfamily hydrolase
MTVAGGMLGRAAANSVFGKNLGAYDLATGKVSLSQVKDNLWSMHDTVRPPAIKLVVTDMDNTLYSFSKYVAPGVRDGIKNLSSKTGIAEEALYKSIGKQMDTYNSFSYPWSIELALSDKLRVGKPGGISYEQFRTTLSDPFWKTIERSLEQNGVAFPQVLPTLEAVRAKQIPVVVLTNASHSIGVKRLDAMGLTRGKLVDRMYVMENPPEPVGLAPQLIRHGRERINVMAAIENDLKSIAPIPKAWEKPDPRGMLEILATYKLRPRQVLMVGDSVKNDIGLAQSTGTRGLLVRYPFTKPEYESVLRKLSEKPKMEKAKMGEGLPANLSNVAETGTFSGVLDHLNPRPDYRVILNGVARSLLVRPEASPAVIAPGLDFDKR